MDSKEAAELIASFERIAKILEAPKSSGGAANVRIDAGGAGIWIATSACLVMLAASFIGSLWMASTIDDLRNQIRDLRERTDVQQAYINSLYTAPKAEESKK